MRIETAFILQNISTRPRWTAGQSFMKFIMAPGSAPILKVMPQGVCFPGQREIVRQAAPTVQANVAYLKYVSGDGQDTVMMGFLAHSMVRTGKGDDTVAVEGFIFKSLIDSGLGDDTLNLNRLVIDSMINGNATGEVSEEEKAAVLDVLDRFMARWNTPNKVEAVEA